MVVYRCMYTHMYRYATPLYVNYTQERKIPCIANILYVLNPFLSSKYKVIWYT